eukprot:Skav233139  [mRNA]  locus=scaffold792:247424:253617:+ [translate_table: standard]
MVLRSPVPSVARCVVVLPRRNPYGKLLAFVHICSFVKMFDQGQHQKGCKKQKQRGWPFNKSRFASSFKGFKKSVAKGFNGLKDRFKNKEPVPTYDCGCRNYKGILAPKAEHSNKFPTQTGRGPVGLKEMKQNGWKSAHHEAPASACSGEDPEASAEAEVEGEDASEDASEEVEDVESS